MNRKERTTRFAFVLLCSLGARAAFAGADSCPGTWRSLQIPNGTNGVADLVNLPDGTLVVGLHTGGLRFYERSAGGSYSWRSVTARAGSISSNKINCLAYFNGELWVGTQDAGINILNLKTDDWRQVNVANSTLPSDYIVHLSPIQADPSIDDPRPTDETLWASTPNGAALYHYVSVGALRGWIWQIVDTADGLPYNFVRDVAVQFVNGNRYTWFALRDWLLRWDGSNFVDYTSQVCDGAETAERIQIDSAGRLWFATIEVVPGLGGGGAGDGGGGTVGYIPSGLCSLTVGRLGLYSWKHFPDQYGHDMSLDDAGRMWFSGFEQFGADSAGGWVHDEGSWCVFRAPGRPLASNEISSVQAMGELTWFGQDQSGVLDTYSRNWSILSKTQLHIPDEIGPIVTGNGTIYVGGLRGFSYRTKPPQPLWVYNSMSNVASATVTSIVPDGSGLWVGVFPDGARYVDINPTTLAIRDVTVYHQEDGLAGEGVLAIAKDKGNRIWVGTSEGLSLKGNGYWLNFTKDNSPLADNGVRALTVDHDGKLWIGTIAGGISILDADTLGGTAWVNQTTADGLAANDIWSLATAQDGTVWAATGAGACAHDPVTGQWTVHNTATGALPGNQAKSVAIDAAGRTWVGTTLGLAMLEAGEWHHFHVTSSTLGDDVVTSVGVVGPDLWAATQNQIAVRADIAGPIGEFFPEITSFSPTTAAPGDNVTVNGKNFDGRGPGYNQVYVGIHDVSDTSPSLPAEVVSASTTKLIFRVPDLADEGVIRVVSHCLEGESAATLKVAPKITSVYPDCLGVGDLITINGKGFLIGSGVQLRFGNGPWKYPVSDYGGELRNDVIKVRIQPDDQSGTLQVRTLSGIVASYIYPISIGHLELDSYDVMQGVEGLRLIWGKRTLVSVRVNAVGCNTKVTGGKLYWKKKDGTRQLGGKAYTRWWDQAYSVEINAPVNTKDEDFGGLEFVGEFESSRSGFNAFFPLSQLNAVQAVVLNNNEEVLTVEIPASELHFKEIKKKLALIGLGVFAEENSSNWNDFWGNATQGMLNTARILPQPDFGPFYGSQAWMRFQSAYITRDSADLRSSLPTSDYGRITSIVDGLIEPGFGQFGMALIDPVLYVDHPDESDPGGKAPLGPYYNGATAVSYNFDGRAAPIISQELSHMLGLVDGDAENHDDENHGHSLYDEGEDTDDSGCAISSYLTYAEAVKDQLGIEYPKLRQLTDGPPLKLDWGSCSDNRAKSCMSYAPSQRDWNAFLEPIDYNAVIHYLDELYDRWADGDGGGGQSAEPSLRIRALFASDDSIEVTGSYLDDTGLPATQPEPGNHHHAVVRDAAGAQMLDLPFFVAFHNHGGEADPTAIGLGIPFPDGAKTVQIYHEDELLWSKSKSPNAPSVSFITPNGNTINADDSAQVSWNASDPDGDPLQFALDYSADGGTTWIELPHLLTGTSYDWHPGFLPKSDSARLRIRASDGFNTTTATSGPFRLTGAQPLVFIASPSDGDKIPEGSLVDLVAHSITSEGADQGSFHWDVDAQPLKGTSAGTEHRFVMTGQRVIKVTLTDASGQQATRQITVDVFPDFDHDGIPNDWEQANGLNPLDLSDTNDDNDGDGLGNFTEFLKGTDPRNADTDGDGVSDGDEVLAGTSPTNGASKPPSVPTLHVGPISIGFTLYEGDVASAPKSFLVSNKGPGSLVWSLSNQIPWLQATPGGGTAPTQVTLVAMPNGLGVGEYEGQIVFSSPGADGSPYTVLVKLTIKPAVPHAGPELIRGDSNGDGKMNISDASFTLTYLFLDATKAPKCIDAADANDDGKVNITDPIYSLGGLFLGGPLPPAPYPGCGPDPTADTLTCGSTPNCP